jgi:C1A family cysteine protease
MKNYMQKMFHRTAQVIVMSLLGLAAAGWSVAYGQLSSADIAALQERGRKEGWTFTVGENSATRRPLSGLCGLVAPPNSGKTAQVATPMILQADSQLPSHFDWRELNGCTPIKDQGDRNCGSCWAFSACGTLECNIKIKDGVDVDLSEQWLISCTGDGTCGGGQYTTAFPSFMTSGPDYCGGSGAVLESYFPYQATDEPCHCPYPHSYWISSWGIIHSGVDSIKQAIMDYGPVSCGISVDLPFWGYTNGIFEGTNLSSGIINHAVVLVGWQDDDSMPEGGYWILRNSWGTGWGEQGYMRIAFGCSCVGNNPCYVNYQTILNQPTSQSVVVTGNATFSVTAPNALYYQWKFNGNDIAGATAATLTLMNVQFSQAGNYTVQVGTPGGPVLSSIAVLTVYPLSPTILTQPADQVVNMGSPASFSVTAIGSLPLSYQWYWNGASIPNATSSTLTFNQPGPENEGNYWVVVSNTEGSITSATAKLSIANPPYVALYGAQNNYTFKGDTTYYIAGGVDLYGTTIFEGGTVVKYRENGGSLALRGPFNCLTAPYRPAVFTSMNDDSVGVRIMSSSGNPGSSGHSYLSGLNYYSDPASTSLYKHMRFLYGGYGETGAIFDNHFTVEDVQFVNCGLAINCGTGTGADVNNTDVFLKNVLFVNCLLCVATDCGSLCPCVVRGTHVTVASCHQFAGGDRADNWGASYAFMTNSIFASSPVYVPAMFGDHNGFLTSRAFGANPVVVSVYPGYPSPFKPVGAGNYYLAANSPFRNAGTTAIDPTLLAEIRQKTTQPPVVYSNVTFSTAITLRPQAQLDTDVPDLGYHYDPLDYLCSCTIRGNGVVILTNGVAVGLFGNSGFSFPEGTGAFVSQGQPNTMNHLVWYPAVQEQPVKIGDIAIPNSPMFDVGYLSGQATTTLQFRFTDIAMQGLRQSLLHTGAYAYDFAVLSFQDCWLRGVNLKVSDGGDDDYAFVPAVTLQNNRLERSTVDLLNGTYSWQDFPLSLSAWNNLFWNSSFTLRYFDRPSTNPPWYIKDNLFDGSALSFTGDSDRTSYVSISNNGFHNTANVLGGVNNVTITDLAYATGPLDSWYIGSASPTLTDQGSRMAVQAGLSDYTERVDQTPEGNTQVDIGFHYVAVDQDGNPNDRNRDGIPDYLEDSIVALSSGTLSGDAFSFSVSGDANTSWTVYSSTDLKNWTPVGAVTLANGNGSFTDSQVNGASYRFYKLSNGTYCSRVIGFTRVTVGLGDAVWHWNTIANQLEAASGNTLASVFSQTTGLPNGTVIWKWAVNQQGYDRYQYSGGVWSPIGTAPISNETLAPGEGAFISKPGSTGSFTVTFVGLVPEGQLTIPLSSAYGYAFVNSMVPQAGGITSVLGYNPSLADMILQWDNSITEQHDFVVYFYDPISLDPEGGSPTGWEDGSYNVVPEPVMNVGESFFIMPANTDETWTRTFSACPPQAPTITQDGNDVITASYGGLGTPTMFKFYHLYMGDNSYTLQGQSTSGVWNTGQDGWFWVATVVVNGIESSWSDRLEAN